MSTPIPLARARVWLTTQVPEWQGSGKTPYLAAALWAISFHAVPGFAKKALGPIGIDDRWRVYYDPKEIDKLPNDQLGAVLLHEVNHAVRGHSDRVGSRDRVLWNIAGDCSINQDLRKDGFTLPPYVVYPETYKMPEGETSEWYYDHLYKNAKKVTVYCNCGSGAHGEKQDHELPGAGEGGKEPQEGEAGVSEVRKEMIRREVAKQIQGMPPGSVSAGLERWAGAIMEPKVPWQTLLQRYLKRGGQVTAGAVDYTYTRPARRRMDGFVLPKMIARQPRAVIEVDTSGSMSSEQITAALGEVKGIARAAGFDTEVMFVDAEVCSKAKAKDAHKKVKGGGGTDMGVGIREAEKMRPRPDVLVILTDCYTHWPLAKPRGVEVIVCSVGEGHKQGYPVPEWAKLVEVA